MVLLSLAGCKSSQAIREEQARSEVIGEWITEQQIGVYSTAAKIKFVFLSGGDYILEKYPGGQGKPTITTGRFIIAGNSLKMDTKNGDGDEYIFFFKEGKLSLVKHGQKYILIRTKEAPPSRSHSP